MSASSRVHRILLAVAAGALLAAGPLAAAPALASGYPTRAACEQAGQQGIRDGHWFFYHCRYYDGGWHLLPE
jgi:hypothetical protein